MPLAPAQAQQAPAAASPVADGAGEIVVTATRRSERLQNVPQSIQAVAGDQLRQMGAVNFGDYGRTIAGVQFQDDGPGRSQIFMRGVSTGGDNDIGKESTVGVYIDETPVSEGSSQPDLKLYDISRVEILRGPQGTLYGSGSLGGTVRIITNQPALGRIAGYGEVIGSLTQGGAGNLSGNAWLNLPIGEKTAIRIVGYGLNNSGYLDNGLTGEKNINGDSAYGGRIALRHQASDRVNIVLSGIYQHSHSDAYNRVTDHYPALIKDQSEPEPFTDRFGVANLKIEADLGFANLTSSSSYFDRTRSYDNDIDYFLDAIIGLPRGRSFTRYHARSFTQETRLASKTEGRFQWLLGGFFVDRDEDYFQTINPRNAPVATTPNANLFYATTNGKVRQISGFGELSYEIFDGLKLTGGLRVAHTTQKTDAIKAGLFFGGVSDEEIGRFKGTATTPKFNVSYKIDSRTLVYAQASKGFRIGGSNPGLPPCASCIVQIKSQFGSDSLWNYEFGVKSQPFGGALTLNASVFWIDWKNIQLSVNREDGFTGFTNAGRARSRGFELEANSRLTRHVRIGGQITYTDAQLRSLNPGLASFATTGTQLPQVPHWAASGNAEWGTTVGRDARLTFRGDLQYQGPRTNILGPTAAPLNDYVIANLRVEYERSTWKVAAFVANLTNVRAQLNRSLLSGARNGIPIALDRITINTPRTIGLSFAKSF